MTHWLAVRGAPPFRLEPGKDVTIGRGRECDLSLYSSLLSREHAAVRWEHGRPVFFDLDSLNGCFIGPDRIRRHQLRDGDLLRLGGEIQVQFRESDEPPRPPPPPDSAETDLARTPSPEGFELGNETQIFSRAAAIQEELSEHDELAWLAERVTDQRAWLPELRQVELADALAGLAFEADVWHLLHLGVVAPSPETELRGLNAREAAVYCQLTKRGDRLCGHLGGERQSWNELANLRYEVRCGRLFRPIRQVARAYRPGGGLDELSPARIHYELHRIYAPKMGLDVLEQELRRFQRLGVFRPRAGAGGEAWYAAGWDPRLVELAPRGRVLLEGFRLEE